MDTEALRLALVTPDSNRSAVTPSPWWAEQILIQNTLLSHILDELRANAANRVAALNSNLSNGNRPVLTVRSGKNGHG